MHANSISCYSSKVVVLTHHLETKQRGDDKVAFLRSFPGQWREIPQPLAHHELVAMGRDVLIDRFKWNNESLRRLCETEKEGFDEIIALWRMPRHERKRKCPEWKEKKAAFLQSHFYQEAHYLDQQAVLQILKDVFKIDVTLICECSRCNKAV